MRRILLLVSLFVFLFPFTVAAEGEGNIDQGGGGMGSGTNDNYWSAGNEGVRITVVRVSDRSPVSTSVDFTNRQPDNTQVHFGKVNKLSYNASAALTPSMQTYTYYKPEQLLPRIISSSSGQSSIEEIKAYFCSEYTLMRIADVTGFDYDVLINGQYKILLEPIAYMTFQGIKMAMTATEAALYDQQLGGGLRSKMVSLSHQNLPLALFLETPDLGYPAWSGSRTSAASNADIISSLGIGIVRFREVDEPPAVETYDYEYRVNTEVITAVTVSGGQADPDYPVSVGFAIGGRTYNVSNVYYPEGDSQRVWVRWTTPSTPQTMLIRVSATGGASSSQGTITARIVDLSGNDPPNPTADDRQDGYVRPALPGGERNTTASWGVWRPWWQANWVWHSNWCWFGDGQGGGYWLDLGRWVDEGWWMFAYDRFQASLSASMSLAPDEKNPTAAGKTMKSGYGVNQTLSAEISTNQPSAVTGIQTAVSYFPEFQYETYWRVLERLQSGLQSRFAFAVNPYSTYNRRTHFTPIWMRDGEYTPYTKLMDSWTPAGMLRMNVNDSVTIRGNLWEDWHLAPANP